jgi:hypothetical protein
MSLLVYTLFTKHVNNNIWFENREALEYTAQNIIICLFLLAHTIGLGNGRPGGRMWPATWVNTLPLTCNLSLSIFSLIQWLENYSKQCPWRGSIHLLMNKTFQRLGLLLRRCLYCLGQPLYVNRHFPWWNTTSQDTDHLLLTLTSQQSSE